MTADEHAEAYNATVSNEARDNELNTTTSPRGSSCVTLRFIMNFIKIVGCMFLGVLPIPELAAQEPQKPVAFLIESLKTYSGKFDAVDGEFTYRIINSQQAMVSTDKAHWQRQGDKERLDVVDVPGADPAAKGKTYENFSVGKQTAIYEPEQKTAILRPDNAYMPLAFKPDEMLLVKYQGKPLYEYLQQPLASPHLIADEEVNKIPCEVIQFDLVSNGKPSGDDVRLYFAKTLGYAPVKLTVDDKQGDLSATTLEYSTSEPITPDMATYEVSSGTHKLNQVECKVDKLTFNPAPTDFSIKLPTGTLVNDLINKKHYLIK